MKAKGTYAVKKWEENTYEQISTEMKMTKASVEYLVSGQISGSFSAEYLMFYKYFDADDQHRSSAAYTGLIRFVGNLEGKEGSFVIEDRGTFENGSAVSALRIMDDSGRGDLKGIKGTGMYSATKDSAQIELDYSL